MWKSAFGDYADSRDPDPTVRLHNLIKTFIVHWHIMKTSLFDYTANFTTKKWKFSDKNSGIFHISAQNIDYGYYIFEQK